MQGKSPHLSAMVTTSSAVNRSFDRNAAVENMAPKPGPNRPTRGLETPRPLQSSHDEPNQTAFDRTAFVRRPLATTVRELPTITNETALFLDVDGTLADFHMQPTAVRVSADVKAAIRLWDRVLSGAVALVSGRTLSDLEIMFDPLFVSAAGTHGAEMRLADDSSQRNRSVSHGLSHQVANLTAALQPMVALTNGLVLETKPMALTLHYRATPEHAALCWQAATALVAQYPNFEVRHGKMIVEIVPAASDKGTAVRAFMAQVPFAGRVPIFVGDDVADEAGFRVAQDLGGIGIRIIDAPQTPTCAIYRVASNRIIRDWLAQTGDA
jgi:trehalose 6-phosphate phosphatase